MIDNDYSPEETAQRRDEVLKRMLNTLPKPRVNSPQSPQRNRKKAAPEQRAHALGKTDQNS